MKQYLHGYPEEENIGGYIVNPHPLAISSCPGCKNRLLPHRENNMYSGGPFSCNNCGTNVTDQIYNTKKS